MSEQDQNTIQKEEKSNKRESITWEEFVVELEGKGFDLISSDDESTDESDEIEFYDFDYSTKNIKIVNLQNKILRRLICIMKEWIPDDFGKTFRAKESITRIEADFFIVLLQVLGKKKEKEVKENSNNEKEEQPLKSILFHLKKHDDWELIPFDKRRLLLKHLKKLFINEMIIKDYFALISEYRSYEEVYALIFIKIRYPSYYSIDMNLNQLRYFFNLEYREIRDILGEEKILEFKNDLND